MPQPLFLGQARALRLALVLGLLLGGVLLPLQPAAVNAATREQVYAVTSANELIQFDSTTPGSLLVTQPITGLQASETIVGIDFRPADGQLYALGDSSRLYTIEPDTGVATPVITQPLTTTLSGAAFGFDFNPVPDRIRVVSNEEQNLRLHPDTGVVVGIDAALAYTTTDESAGINPAIVGAAYTNNVSGSITTTLYLLDAGTGNLVRQGGVGGTPSPNSGLLFTVGPLGVEVDDFAGFDISPGGTALAASSGELYTIDLATGSATSLGAIDTDAAIVGLTIKTVELPPVPEETLYAVTSSNRLIRFTSTDPATLTASQPITGLQASETIVGIDFRPATGELYALGNSSRLYTVAPDTGVATPVITQPLTTTLSGAAFGFDFNPVPDRIRVVSDEEQNLHLHPDTGAVVGVDATLAYTPTDVFSATNPTIVGAAYTNNVSGSITTTLYLIDAGTDSLVRQGGVGGTPSPNGGVLSTVGSLGLDADTFVGFDITPDGTAFAAITTPGGSASYLALVDLATGTATRLTAIGGGETIVGLAAPTVEITPPPPPPALPQEPVFAVTGSNRLIRFNSASPGLLTASQPITGLQASETILGIDFRPATGELYALGSTSRLYRLDPLSGAASLVITQPLTTTLSGTAFGFDFNPVPDRIRVVSDEEQNLRLHPDTGVVVGVDTTLAYTPTDVFSGTNPTIVGAAYTNNVSGTATTTLYGIDAGTDSLVRQGGVDGPPSPNGGVLSTIGALGVDADNLVGFDISPSGAAFVAITGPGGVTSTFGTVDLATGQVTAVGAIGGGETIVGLAAPTVAPGPPPATTLLAVTEANRLLQFVSTEPSGVVSATLIVGLEPQETVAGIDFRPATGELYALGSTSRLYKVKRSTGSATLVGTQPLTTTLNGAAFGFDFNPLVDRIRVVSEAEQNLRLHPDTGVVVGVDATLAYTPTDILSGTNPSIVGAAYTNNISGTTSTTLYVIDAAADTLALQGGPNGSPSPNGGRLFTVGSLGVDADNLVGFDIAPSGDAFAAIAEGNTTNLYAVDLASGRLTLLGSINQQALIGAQGQTEAVVALAAIAGPPPSARLLFPILFNQQ
jgi:trimeric autotransporter adhesin